MSSRTLTGVYDQSGAIAHSGQHATTVPAGSGSSNNARLSAEQVALMLSAESRTARRHNLHTGMLPLGTARYDVRLCLGVTSIFSIREGRWN